jgi:hypothetical protein
VLRVSPEVSPFKIGIAGEKMDGFVKRGRFLQKGSNGNETKDESKNA